MPAGADSVARVTASEREVALHVEAACPRCGSGPHPVDLVARLVPGTLLFAGKQPAAATLLGVASLTCPVTDRPYEVSVRVPGEAGERLRSLTAAPATAEDDGGSAHQAPPVVGPASPEAAHPGATVTSTAAAEATASAATAAPSPPAHDDVADLRRTSAGQARDAAGKLLGAGTAAIAAYFTILKFVAGDQLDGWRQAVAVVPALGYAAVTVLAAVAARPLLLSVGDARDLETQRDALLRRLDRLLRAAVAVFAGATVASAVVYLLVWP